MPDRAIAVVDASAVAAVLFNEPAAEQVVDRLAGSRLVGTTLMPYEVANVCVSKIARYPEQKEVLLDAFSMLDTIGIDLVSAPSDHIVRLACEVGLTAYDASYLWLARELQSDLVTLDRALERAWRAS